MKYPVGIQDFRKIREDGFVYVDKTEHIHHILNTSKYFFLSRPRRFGKSLLLSTLKELYSGSRELFEGLWIEKHWDWSQSNPVIWLRFASQGVSTLGLAPAIHNMVDSVAQELGITLGQDSFDQKFKELLQKASAGGRRAVLLIDEYDKPIIDYLEDPDKAEANRDTLKQFYSVLKDSDPHLQLVFITGVSAFSKVSIFSDLNNLTNLSLHRLATTLLGITQEEVLAYFSDALRLIAQEQGIEEQAMIEKVKFWYNGYSWDAKHKVYNPFSLLSFFLARAFRNFWFETGTPTFLVREMKRRELYNIRLAGATSVDLSNFDLRRLNPITVLFQTGYLTIARYDEEDLLYTLDYPNMEVRHSLQEVLLNEYLDYPVQSASPRVVAMRNALRNNDIAQVVEIINAAFAQIPSHLWAGQNEHFYHAVTHLMFSMLGTFIQSEVNSSKGRCDALVQTDDHIFAFEFKLDGSADEALRQIRERGYLAPYADSPKQRIAVGINFSSSERQITEWKVEGI